MPSVSSRNRRPSALARLGPLLLRKKLLLLLLFLVLASSSTRNKQRPCACLAFAPTINNVASSKGIILFNGATEGIRRLPLAMGSNIDSTMIPTTTTTSPQAMAQELLALLLERYRGNGSNGKTDEAVIADYVAQLTEARVTFDLQTCFNDNDGVHAVLHQQGPNLPLWEKISRGSSRNIKGQQYTYRADTQDFALRNYAEIWGPRLFVQVEGTALEQEEPETDQDEKTAESTGNNFLDNLTDFLPKFPAASNSSKKDAAASSTLRTCPCDIVAKVQGGGLYGPGKKLWWNLSFIQGTGLVRVLYADTNLRILESPTQNDGGWEDAGLIVVQVRRDLLLSSSAD